MHHSKSFCKDHVGNLQVMSANLAKLALGEEAESGVQAPR
jgi:hypothetical protein